MNLRLILNEELPEDLREALLSDAETNGVTVNDAANKVLSSRFGTKWRKSGFPYREVSQRFKLRVPEDLHREMRIEAADRLVTIRGVALNTLSGHYGTEEISPNRRPRKEAV